MEILLPILAIFMCIWRKKKKKWIFMDGATVSLLSEISINLSFSFHNDIDDIIENGTSRSCNNFNTDIERKFNVQKFLIIKLIKFKLNYSTQS